MSSTKTTNDSQNDENSLLIILWDANPVLWSLREKESGQSITFDYFLEHLFAFINAYLLLGSGNKLAVIATLPNESHFVFPSVDNENNSLQINDVQDSVIQRLRDIVVKLSQSYTPSELESPMFSGSLSLSLCYINRMQKENPSLKPRILVLQISPDVPSQYISIMNCIFSAQKKSILVDSCILSQQDSSFLQQASSLTGGIYVKPNNQNALLQYLLTCFLPDVYARKLMLLPALTKVDFRASCFCHKKTIDLGYVCSVCLSIFCDLRISCTTCGTRFKPAKRVPKQTKMQLN